MILYRTKNNQYVIKHLGGVTFAYTMLNECIQATKELHFAGDFHLSNNFTKILSFENTDELIINYPELFV